MRIATAAMQIICFSLACPPLGSAQDLQWEVGDVAPDFQAFIFQDQPVFWYDETSQDTDYHVVSTCAMWCAPCQAFAADAQTIVDTLGNEGVLVEMYDWIFQDSLGLVADDVDATIWRNAVWTSDPTHVWYGGNIPLTAPSSVVENIFLSNDSSATPNILVLDNQFVIRGQMSGYNQSVLVNLLRALTPDLGDVNQDGMLNLLDVDPFIDVLSSGEYQFEADCNEDGLVNLLDIDPFILLIGG